MMTRTLIFLILFFVVTRSQPAMDPYYQEEFSNDNLYHDYAARQQEKQLGAP
jgi:hypothetical protein